ncbi:MAG: hypothetical protein CTY16_19140 [Methylobacter sp.]|nr:MAG: hypothetical protein CTY16_19140 [Methylobacter sp.]
MNTKKLLLLGFFPAFILLAAPVSAKNVLFTPMVEIATANPGAPLSSLRCNVLNAFHAPRNGTISIINADGTILSTTSFTALQPQQVVSVVVDKFTNPTPITLAYCKITVHRTKGSIRGSLSRTDERGNSVIVVEAK